jgi:SdpI/YfhL protein family
MDPVRGQALMMAGFIEIALAAMSVLMVANWRRAARGKLARNAYVGVRTRSTLRSPEAWVAGNRAAVGTAPLYVLFNAAMCAGLLAAALHGWRLVIAFIGGGFFALIALMVCTAVIASRAARKADDHTDSRSAASQPIEIPDVASPLSGRRTKIIGWICAVAACAVTVHQGDVGGQDSRIASGDGVAQPHRRDGHDGGAARHRLRLADGLLGHPRISGSGRSTSPGRRSSCRRTSRRR